MRVQELDERIALVARASPLFLEEVPGMGRRRRGGAARRLGARLDVWRARRGRREGDIRGAGTATKEERRKEPTQGWGEIVGAMQAKVAASGGFS